MIIPNHNHALHQQIVGDTFTGTASFGAVLAWFFGYVTGPVTAILTILVLTASLVYYIIQIHDSPWWKRRRQRRHRARLRRHRRS